MLWAIILILVVLWLLGFFGKNINSNFPKTGGWIHVLLVIALILLILQLLGVI
jgi:ABC-type multidrug transport system permease subunit